MWWYWEVVILGKVKEEKEGAAEMVVGNKH